MNYYQGSHVLDKMKKSCKCTKSVFPDVNGKGFHIWFKENNKICFFTFCKA